MVLISNIRWLRAVRGAPWSSKRPRPWTSSPTVKSAQCNGVRSMLFPQPWMFSYEESLAGGSQHTSLDLERTAFFHRGALAGVSGDFSRYAQARLAAADVLQADRFSLGRTRGSAAFRWFRRQPDEFLHEQPRQPFRSFHAVLRDSAICAGMGARIALQDSRVRLADEALWQRAGAGCATAVGFEAYVSVCARRCRWGHQLDYFSGS